MTEARTDVLYLAWNRLEYTKVTFPLLIANTDWDIVNSLIVYDDGSTDGTREYLDQTMRDRRDELPPTAGLTYLGYRSPVKTMVHYINQESVRRNRGEPHATRFAKIDNDIAVPPGWLNALTGVMDAYPALELLGMQIGFGGDTIHEDAVWYGDDYGFVPARHIGGVGLMRTASFIQRQKLMPAGRFGFTDWQERNDPVRGWLTPDIYCPQMDLLPFSPWQEIAALYVENGWQREWPPYDWETTRFWDWIPGLPGVNFPGGPA